MGRVVGDLGAAQGIRQEDGAEKHFSSQEKVPGWRIQ